MKIVIALGGNAIIKKGEKQTYSNLINNIKKTCKQIVPVLKKNKVLITHGNGSEIGYLAIQNEIAKQKVPAMPLDVLGAESQALIGYIFEEQLRNFLRENRINKPIVNIITQTLVDKDDKAFREPTKPIGPFYNKPQAQELRKKGFHIIEDAGRGYRRVVPSPLPLKIIEETVIKDLIKHNFIVIAVGGGGIPVYLKNNKLYGTEAVIDKDLASQVLANDIEADLLLILTGVPYVYLNYLKKNEKIIKKMNVKQAKQYIKENQFAEGSMKPKIQAAINFLQRGGKKVIITDSNNLMKALNNKAGTLIVK
ncbi:MAG: Carbamate kinase [archaeon GW2011_AR20]|nr:MAG: Carbamate kinase [archaeon GW2011_AR20]MBS3160898.1 carbamate kinase [Candidatus Woesearchaeota archaeon]